MPSQAERRKEAEASAKRRAASEKALQEHYEAGLEGATEPTEEELRESTRRIAPLVVDEDHAFVPVEETDQLEADPSNEKIVQPDLTPTGVNLRVLEEEKAEEARQGYKGLDKRTEVTSLPRETEIERMSDDQIKEAGFLKSAAERELIHPARLSPSSERPRTPLQRSPAAGPGSWPVPEDALPAAMPSDPPIEDRLDEVLGDNTFKGVTGFSTVEGGLSLKGPRAGTTVKIDKKEVTAAAALYMRLRQQYPHFTTDQLNDEFALQWEGGIGRSQSHRPGTEVSSHGLTAVGDDRVVIAETGKERLDAPLAEPVPSGPEMIPAPQKPGAGLPTENEPSTRAPDMAKEPGAEGEGETEKPGTIDAEAMKTQAKLEPAIKKEDEKAAAIKPFDHDGDGKPGGAPPGGNAKKK